MLPVSTVLICWIGASAILFGFMRPVRALAMAYLVGWLLMPVGQIQIQGFWDVDKIMATNLGVVLGTLLFHPERFRGYRFHVADALVLAYCVSKLFSSMSNELGAYDGLSRLSYEVFFYAAPYLAGRLFLRTREDLNEVARMIVVATAMYAFLALWEWRMSPRVHRILYGVFQHDWRQHKRWGMWRPILCFPHALGLGIFFAWTSILGVWLYRSGQLGRKFWLPAWCVLLGPILLWPATIQFGFIVVMLGGLLCGIWAMLVIRWASKTGSQGRHVIGIPSWAIMLAPIAGLITSMSVGPYVLFVVGCGLLYVYEKYRLRWVLYVPVAFALMWMTLRFTSISDGRWLAEGIGHMSPRAAISLTYRIEAETLILDHTKERPIFGWASWGRNRIKDEKGENAVAIDALWLNVISTDGLVGLTTFYLWWFCPVVMFVRAPDSTPQSVAMRVVVVSVAIQGINLLFNGFLSPILPLLFGCVVTLLHQARHAQASAVPQPGGGYGAQTQVHL